jgi:TRAP-type transport system small permease protein
MPDKKDNFIQKISDSIEWVVGRVSILLFGAMTAVVLVGVLFRYGFRVPLSWTEELSRYLMIWGASLAVSTGIKYDEHVGLTVLYDSIKNVKVKLLLQALITLLVLGFLMIMTQYSITMALDSKYQIAQSLGISMFIPTLAVPVAMGIAAVQLVLTFILRLKRRDPGEYEAKIIDI